MKTQGSVELRMQTQRKGWIRRSQSRAEALLYLAKASLR
jgi:hypothetical protein